MKIIKLFVLFILVSQSFCINSVVPGTFTQITGSPFAAGAGPASSSYSPLVSGNLFSATPNFRDNTVTVYQVDQTTGVFTQVAGSPFPTGGLPAWQAFSPLASGNLFSAVANFNDNTVSVYEVNQTTGAFTPVLGSPFATGAEPASIQFSPLVSGNLFAAVANAADNTVSVYQVNQATGLFTAVIGSPFATGAEPNFATFSPVVSGNLFAAVVNASGNTVSVYEVNQTTGAFVEVVGSPFATGLRPLNIAFSPLVSGNLFAAITNLNDNTVSVYEVNQTTGAFTPIPTSPFNAASGPNVVAFSPIVSGDLFAAVVNFNSNNVSVYEVNQSNGAFTQIVGSPFATGGEPDGIAFSPVLAGNLFATIANLSDNNVNVYQVATSPLPIVISITPSEGPSTGGTLITITGINFTGATAVFFGANPAISFVVNSDMQITAVSPSGSGTVDVTVTTASGTSVTSSADQYTYLSATSPLPPSNFFGVIIKNKFLTQTECFLKAKWKASPSSDVTLYRIYKNNKLVKDVASTSPLVFIKCLRKCSAKGYEIASVNSNNRESSRVKLVILKKVVESDENGS